MDAQFGKFLASLGITDDVISKVEERVNAADGLEKLTEVRNIIGQMFSVDITEALTRVCNLKKIPLGIRVVGRNVIKKLGQSSSDSELAELPVILEKGEAVEIVSSLLESEVEDEYK